MKTRNRKSRRAARTSRATRQTDSRFAHLHPAVAKGMSEPFEFGSDDGRMMMALTLTLRSDGVRPRAAAKRLGVDTSVVELWLTENPMAAKCLNLAAAHGHDPEIVMVMPDGDGSYDIPEGLVVYCYTDREDCLAAECCTPQKADDLWNKRGWYESCGRPSGGPAPYDP